MTNGVWHNGGGGTALFNGMLNPCTAGMRDVGLRNVADVAACASALHSELISSDARGTPALFRVGNDLKLLSTPWPCLAPVKGASASINAWMSLL